MFFSFFLFFQAADGRWARAEECGGWQEATASLLRKTRTEEKRRRKKEKGDPSAWGGVRQGRRNAAISLRISTGEESFKKTVREEQGRNRSGLIISHLRLSIFNSFRSIFSHTLTLYDFLEACSDYLMC